MTSLLLDQAFHGLQNDILDSYEWFIFFVWFYFGKIRKILEKRPDMAGLGKYHTGGYGRIGVYRVKMNKCGKQCRALWPWEVWGTDKYFGVNDCAPTDTLLPTYHDRCSQPRRPIHHSTKHNGHGTALLKHICLYMNILALCEKKLIYKKKCSSLIISCLRIS